MRGMVARAISARACGSEINSPLLRAKLRQRSESASDVGASLDSPRHAVGAKFIYIYQLNVKFMQAVF
jgi:hypothetical protein